MTGFRIQSHGQLDQPRLIVAIPTYRRPDSLLRLLQRLDLQTTSLPFAVIVADNDAAGQQGIGALQAMDSGQLGFPVHAVVAETPGLAGVRNTLLATALQFPSAELIAMIDDDEWPEVQWLESLVAVQHATGADVVGGPVLPVFEERADETIAMCRLFQHRNCDSGPVDIVWATNNVLLKKSFITAAGPGWFDESYGLSGGEDSDFFIKHHMLGRRFAWCAEAIVYEDVPPHRASLHWIVRRAFRIGNTNAHIQRRRRYRGRGPAKVLVLAVGKLVAAVAGAPLRAAARRSRVNALYELAEACGMLCGACGLRFHEYAR